MDLTKTSRFISLILRHKPEVIGITLDEHGWADAQQLIAGVSKTNPIDMDILEEIVRTDDKQRYSFNEDKTLIRANQGHSIPVDVELPERTPPAILYHGTGEKYVPYVFVADGYHLRRHARTGRRRETDALQGFVRLWTVRSSLCRRDMSGRFRRWRKPSAPTASAASACFSTTATRASARRVRAVRCGVGTS